MSMARKASKDQKTKFSFDSKNECSEKIEKGSRKMPMLKSFFSTIIMRPFQIKTSSRLFLTNAPRLIWGNYLQNSSEQLHVKNLNFFSNPNNYRSGRVVQGQLSKFTRRNTVTASRSLVNSHKNLKRTEAFTRRNFRKTLL